MKSEEKNRILYLDIIRIVACIMVITQHAPMPEIGTNSMLLSATSFLTYPCIGLFFMVSGALLLPVKQASSVFYRRRLTKVAIPTIVWTLLYLLLDLLKGNYPIIYILKSIVSIPLMPGVPAFWFIYVLIGLYLFAPIISPWLEKTAKSEIRLFLVLWGISLLIPVLNGYMNIPYGYYSVLCYFSGYLGYFVLGYYLRNYQKEVSLFSTLFLIGIPILAYAICKYYNMKSDFNTYYYLSIFSAPMTMGWFLLLKKLFENVDLMRGNDLISSLSNACFGIYLVHLLVMRNILWEIDVLSSYGGFLQIVLTSLLTLFFSYIIVYLLSKLPFSKYLIGY